MDHPSPAPAALSAENLLQHGDFLRRLARGLLADEHEVEDVVQETWTIALERPPRSEEALRSWLARVVQNLSRNRLRRASRREAREEEAARGEALPSTDEVAARLALQRRMVAAVSALPEPYRSAIWLRWYEGLAPREIARLRGLSVQTVHSQLKRAHARLARELEREYGDRRSWSLALLSVAGRRAPPFPLWAGAACALALPLVALGLARSDAGAAPAPVVERAERASTRSEALDTAPVRVAALEGAGTREAAATSAASAPAREAYALRGRVLRAHDRSPLAGLTVVVEGADGASEELATDAEGRLASTGEHVEALLCILDGPERHEIARRAVRASEAEKEQLLALGPAYRLEIEGATMPGTELVAWLALPGADRPATLALELRPGAWPDPRPWVRFPRAPEVGLMDHGGRSMYALHVATRDGLAGASARVHARAGDYPDVVHLRLEPRAALSGTLVDGAGEVLAGALLALEGGEGGTRAATSDDAGEFRMDAVSAGAHRLRVRAPTCAVLERELVLDPGVATEIALALESLPCAPLEGALASQSGAHRPAGRARLAKVDEPERVLWAEPVAGAVPGEHAFRFPAVPCGEYELLPPMEDGFAWSPPSRRVVVPGHAARFECLDDLPTAELVVRARDASGAPLERARAVVLVDRYALGARAAAAFEPVLSARELGFGEVAARVPDGFALAWVVEAEGCRSRQGSRADLREEAGRLVADVRLAPSWRVDLWIGTRDESGRPIPLSGVELRTIGGRSLGTSLGDGELRVELVYDPGRLVLELEGWRVESWEGFWLGSRQAELDLHRVFLEPR